MKLQNKTAIVTGASSGIGLAIAKLFLQEGANVVFSDIKDNENDFWKNTLKLVPYKKTHVNHPMSIWVRACVQHFIVSGEIGLELCREYTYRYSKTHKCESMIKRMLECPPLIFPENINPQLPPLCMPEKYRKLCNSWSDVVQSYRAYYLGEKLNILTYKKRCKPYWIS